MGSPLTQATTSSWLWASKVTAPPATSAAVSTRATTVRFVRARKLSIRRSSVGLIGLIAPVFKNCGCFTSPLVSATPGNRSPAFPGQRVDVHATVLDAHLHRDGGPVPDDVHIGRLQPDAGHRVAGLPGQRHPGGYPAVGGEHRQPQPR